MESEKGDVPTEPDPAIQPAVACEANRTKQRELNPARLLRPHRKHEQSLPDEEHLATKFELHPMKNFQYHST